MKLEDIKVGMKVRFVGKNPMMHYWVDMIQLPGEHALNTPWITVGNGGSAYGCLPEEIEPFNEIEARECGCETMAKEHARSAFIRMGDLSKLRGDWEQSEEFKALALEYLADERRKAGLMRSR